MSTQLITEPMGFSGLVGRALKIAVTRAHHFLGLGLMQTLAITIPTALIGFGAEALIGNGAGVTFRRHYRLHHVSGRQLLRVRFVTRYTSLRIRGVQATAGQIAKTIRGRVLGRVIGTGFLAFLAIFVGFLLLFIPGVILGVYLLLTMPIVIEENIGFRKAMRRSFNLVKGQWWYTLGAFLSVYFVIGLLSQVFSGLLSLLAVGSGVEEGRIIGDLVGFFLLSPFQFIVFTLLYYEARLRKGETALVAAAPVQE